MTAPVMPMAYLTDARVGDPHPVSSWYARSRNCFRRTHCNLECASSEGLAVYIAAPENDVYLSVIQSRSVCWQNEAKMFNDFKMEKFLVIEVFAIVFTVVQPLDGERSASLLKWQGMFSRTMSSSAW